MKKYAFPVVLIAGLLLFSVSTVSVADELVLVKEGAAPAPIVVFEDAPPITRQAADELAEYIETISGARPKVIEGKPDPCSVIACRCFVPRPRQVMERLTSAMMDSSEPSRPKCRKRNTACAAQSMTTGREQSEPSRLCVHSP